MTDRRDERAREGVGDAGQQRPREEGGDLDRERDVGRTDRDANADSGEAFARREIPGGDHPARTPGATGPTTRDVRAASEGRSPQGAVPEESDANEQLVGRARLGEAMKRPLHQNNPSE